VSLEAGGGIPCRPNPAATFPVLTVVVRNAVDAIDDRLPAARRYDIAGRWHRRVNTCMAITSLRTHPRLVYTGYSLGIPSAFP